MFGCLKILNAKKTYVVNKPVPDGPPSIDSSPKATPPKRKVTKHSIHVKRPTVEENDDTSQQQNQSVPTKNESKFTSSTEPAKNGVENGNKSNVEVHTITNKTNGNLKNENESTPEIKIDTRTTNVKTEKVSNENEDVSLEKNHINKQVAVEQISSINKDNVKEVETTKTDDIKVNGVENTETIVAENLSEFSTAKTNVKEKPNAETSAILVPIKLEKAEALEQIMTHGQVETNQINERTENEAIVKNGQTEVIREHQEDTSVRLRQEVIHVQSATFHGESRNEENHRSIVSNYQAETIREQQDVVSTHSKQEVDHVQSERIQLYGEAIDPSPHISTNQTSERNHQIRTETISALGHQQIATENKKGKIVHGNVIHPSSEINVTTNTVQNGHLLNGEHDEVVLNNEVMKVQKSEGVKFVEDVDVMIYENSDSDSIYDGGVDETGLPTERREGVRETVKIDDEQVIKTHPKSEQEALEIKKAFLANEFLETVLKDDQLNTLVDAMYLREVEEHEIIIQEGEPGNHLYVSAGGTFDVYVNQKKVNSFSDFRVFGELAILYNAKRMATIKSMTTGRIWVLHRSIYQRTLVQDAIRDYEETLSFLQNVPTINMMKTEKLKKIANLLKKEFFKTDTVIVQQGDIGDKFYIIRAGNVTVTRKDEGKVAELSKGAYFGERALLQEDCRQATVTADPPGVECLTLTRAEFKEHFDDDYFNQSASDQQSQSQSGTESKEPGEFAEIQLDDLKRVETLGVGGFGRVELVQHKKQTNLTFALKYLKKVDMVQQGQVDHVFNEKNIQISCNSVFVVRMYKTFSDNKYLYFLMESCQGGDLWTFLQRQKGRHVGDSAARFFAGCVLEALTYLHDRDYIYRDLKPENLIIDNNGYIKLTDFGFAKYIGRNGRTFTFAGTPEYVAPEIVYNRGHDKAVDYWAFGIFIFELLVGRTPFRSDDPSHMRTYNRILRGINSVQFPPSVSKLAVSIIQKLCKAIPTERLGCQKNGAQDIRNHKWFQPLDWNKLRNRKVKAPFVPKLQSNVDTKYFEKFKPDDDVPPDELVGFDDFES